MPLLWSLAALIPLNNYGHYIHWGVIDVSVANVVVVVLMIAVFIAALLLPFPGRARRRGDR